MNSRRPRRLACTLLFLSTLALSRGWSATTLVGDPKNPGALPQAILDAHAHGATDITIAPGTYDIPSQNHGDTIVLDGWSDTTIHASGTTLIFEALPHRPLLFRNCRQVTWDGGTLRFAQPAYTQGRVTAIGSDATGNTCTWQLDAGYPAQLQDRPWFNVVDPATRRLKIGVGDQGLGEATLVSPGVFRMHFPQKPGFAVGDWLVARAEGGYSVVVHENCEACTTENVTLQNAGWGAFFELNGAGANRYLHCTVEPGPRPAGATEDELVGGGADGFHSNATRIGPDIEDFTCRGVFSDDCIAIHGMLHRVLRSEGARLLIDARNFHPLPGDPLRIASVSGFFAQGTITKVEPNTDDTVWLTLDRDLHVPLDPSGETDPKKGTQASDPDECGAGYKILGCHLGDTRSRGILVKADNGIIDGCTLEGCGMSAISIGPEFWWREAGYSWHVTVSNNQIIGCAQINGDPAPLYIHGDGAIGNRDIVVKNNTFTGNYGFAIADLEFADGVDLTDNKFNHSFPLPPLAGTGFIVHVMQCHNVKLSGNVVANQGTGASALVHRDASVSAADVQGDDPSGIVLSH
jgi:hypothetical protein